MRKLRRQISAMLSAVMIVSCIPAGVMQAQEKTDVKAVSESSRVESVYEKRMRETGKLKNNNNTNDSELPGYGPEDKVHIIVELKQRPVTNTTGEYTAREKRQLRKLEKEHEEVKEDIEDIIEDSDGEYGYDYYTVMNGFSVEAEYADLENIEELPGVKRAYVAKTYKVDLPDNTIRTQMASSVKMVGSDEADNSGYSGKGMVVAVIDSGLDVNHEAFGNAPKRPRLSKEDVGEIIETKNLAAKKASVEESYISEKIPYVYDYADKDADVAPGIQYGGEHGTHVSGTVGADSDKLTGVSKDCQLMMFKVFDSITGYTTDDTIIAALDDAVKMGVDSINMSLGSDCGFTESDNDAEQEIYERIREADIHLAVAAGNAYSGAKGSLSGNDRASLRRPDYSIVASPSTYESALSVASMVNTSLNNVPYAMVGGRKIMLIDTSSENDPKIYSREGTYEYVYCNYGRAEDFQGVGNIRGKIALMKRGKNEFGDKVSNAAKAGAAAAVIMNNEEGTVSMSINDYPISAVSISLKDGNYMRDMVKTEMTFNPEYIGQKAQENAYMMSDFSSCGVSPDLKLKPEITAPGENIYSAIPDNNYTLMSGTSMATPHIAGLFADLKQYVKETYPALDNEQVYNLVNALLMSTASPARDKSGEYYSPRKQGAGLANVNNAIKSKAYITVEGQDKPKAELGDNTDGRFRIEFTINNLSADRLSFKPELIGLLEKTEDGYFTESWEDKAGKGVDYTFDGIDNDGYIIVEGGGRKKVSVELALTDELKKSLDDTCPNGSFLDGFVRLESTDTSDLSVPYLGFYGDWGRIPVIDETAVSGNAEMFGCSVSKDYGQVTVDLGSNIIDATLNGVVEVNEDRYIISPYGMFNYASVLATQTGLLRNAKKMTYTVTDKDGNVFSEKTYHNVRKSYQYAYKVNTWAEAFISGTDFDGRDKDNNELEEGWYTYTVKAWADGADEDECDTWSFPFAYDKTNGKLDSYKVVREDGKTYLDMKMSDNNYLSAYSCVYDNEIMGNIEILKDPDTNADGSYVTNEDGDRVYSVKADITDILKKIIEKGELVTTIYVEIYDYALNYTRIPVTINKISPSKILLDKTEIEIIEDATDSLTVSYEPDNTTEKQISWSSEDESIATVDEQGNVKGVSAGETVITAEAVNGRTAECKVTVKENNGIFFEPDSMDVIIGTTYQIKPVVSKRLAGKTLRYESSDTEVAEVDGNGLVTCKKQGNTIITVSLADDSSVSAEFRIRCTAKDQADFVTDENGVLIGYRGSSEVVNVPESVTAIGDNVFQVVNTMKKIVIPPTVKSIGKEAFIECENLREIVFTGDGLEEIGESAFEQLSSLAEIKLPSSVNKIGAKAFYRCSNLQNINIPEGITVINAETFSYCGLGTVRLPDSVEYIGDGAFYSSSLSSVTLSSSLKKIGERAFGVNNIPSIVIPDSVEEIGKQAFVLCSSLGEVTIGKGLKKIGEGAFSETGLGSVDIPDNVETLEESAFYNISQLKKVKIGSGVNEIGHNCFNQCGNLESIDVADTNEVYASVDGVLFDKEVKTLIQYTGGKNNKEYIMPKTVEIINADAFSSMPLEKIGLSNSLKRIEKGAFSGVSMLKSITFPDSLESIGSNAFQGCAGLSRIIFGKGLKSIGNYAFAYDEAIKELDFKDSLEEIGGDAFDNCYGIERVNLPDSLKTLKNRVFINCIAIKSIHLGEMLDNIEDGAFTNLRGLEEISISGDNKNYKVIDGVLFDKAAESLILYPAANKRTTYVLPDSVKVIKQYAFMNADIIERVVLPEGITTLEQGAFNQADRLKDINLPDSITTMGSVVFSDTVVRSLVIPPGVKNLDMMFAAFNSELRYLDISKCESLDIGMMAFAGDTNIETIIAGDNVKSYEFGFDSEMKDCHVYAPRKSLMQEAAATYGMTFHRNNMFASFVTPYSDMGTIGVPMYFQAGCTGYKGDVTYSAEITCKSDSGIKEMASDRIKIDRYGRIEVIPDRYGVYELKVTAKDSDGNISDTEKSVVEFAVVDEPVSRINFEEGRYAVKAHLMNIMGDSIIDEDVIIKDTRLHVYSEQDEDNYEMTKKIEADIRLRSVGKNGAAMKLTGAEYYDGKNFKPVTVNKKGDDGGYKEISFGIPDMQRSVFLRLTFGERKVDTLIRFDYEDVVAVEEEDNVYEFEDGTYDVAASFKRADWNELLDDNESLKDAFMYVDNGMAHAVLTIEPYKDEDGTHSLNSISVKSGDIYLENRASEEKEGESVYDIELPDNKANTRVILNYADISRAAKIYLDMDNAVRVSGDIPSTQKESPKPSDTPKVTDEPKTTSSPENTESPKPTGKPDVTSGPQTTEVPNSTEVPHTTEAPHTTEVPHTTEAPVAASTRPQADTAPAGGSVEKISGADSKKSSVKPSKVKSVKASYNGKKKKLTVKWTKSKKADKYIIYIRKGKKYKKVKVTKNTVYVFNKIKKGKKIKIKICAVNENGKTETVKQIKAK